MKTGKIVLVEPECFSNHLNDPGKKKRLHITSQDSADAACISPSTHASDGNPS